MDRDQVEGSWLQLKGDAKRVWGDLTEDDFKRAEGFVDKLVGIIQERFGDAREHPATAARLVNAQSNKVAELTSSELVSESRA